MEVGVGPEVLRTESWGTAVSARVLVMVGGAGVAGGESLVGAGGEVFRGSGRSRGAVCRLVSGGGRTAALWDEAEAEAVAAKGDAGGVWVLARGRVLGGDARGPSAESAECRCRPWV